jgi:hypothetical protein
MLNFMPTSSEMHAKGEPEAGVLDKPYSAKPAQLSSHTGQPGYIGWTGHGSSLCRLAGHYSYSAEWGYLAVV